MDTSLEAGSKSQKEAVVSARGQRRDHGDGGFVDIDEDLQSLHGLVGLKTEDLLPEYLFPVNSEILHSDATGLGADDQAEGTSRSKMKSSKKGDLDANDDEDAVKPPYHYSDLIEFALRENQMLTVSEIYEWIATNFPYFRRLEETRWKPAVRHTLTTNSAFFKAKKAQRGFLWGYREPHSNQRQPVQRPHSLEVMDNSVKGHWKKQKLAEYETKRRSPNAAGPRLPQKSLGVSMGGEGSRHQAGSTAPHGTPSSDRDTNSLDSSDDDFTGYDVIPCTLSKYHIQPHLGYNTTSNITDGNNNDSRGENYSSEFQRCDNSYYHHQSSCLPPPFSLYGGVQRPMCYHGNGYGHQHPLHSGGHSERLGGSGAYMGQPNAFLPYWRPLYRGMTQAHGAMLPMCFPMSAVPFLPYQAEDTQAHLNRVARGQAVEESGLMEEAAHPARLVAVPSTSSVCSSAGPPESLFPLEDTAARGSTSADTACSGQSASDTNLPQ